MLKKWLLTLAILAAIATVLVIALLWTVRPTEALDLNYKPISVSAKIKEMIASRSLELRLTEEELNQIMKRELAVRKLSLPNVQIQGARFQQDGQMVTAHVQAELYGLIRMQAALSFRLKWEPPNLVVEHVKTKAGPWTVPVRRFHLDPIVVPIDDELPPLVAIKDVKFEPSAIAVSFRLK